MASKAGSDKGAGYEELQTRSSTSIDETYLKLRKRAVALEAQCCIYPFERRAVSSRRWKSWDLLNSARFEDERQPVNEKRRSLGARRKKYSPRILQSPDYRMGEREQEWGKGRLDCDSMTRWSKKRNLNEGVMPQTNLGEGGGRKRARVLGGQGNG